MCRAFDIDFSARHIPSPLGRGGLLLFSLPRHSSHLKIGPRPVPFKPQPNSCTYILKCPGPGLPDFLFFIQCLTNTVPQSRSTVPPCIGLKYSSIEERGRSTTHPLSHRRPKRAAIPQGAAFVECRHPGVSHVGVILESLGVGYCLAA